MTQDKASIGFGTGITTMDQLREAEENMNNDFDNFKGLKTEQIRKPRNCSQLEINLLNTEAKLFTLKQRLEKAYGELTVLNSKRQELKDAFKKEKSVISGDKAKARNTGAAIGTIIGGAIANLPGAAIGLGVGGNIGTLAEEGFDLATGQKTDYHFRKEIHEITQKINDVQKMIQIEIKSEIQETEHLIKQQARELKNCQNGN